jgi:hypothetical protein
MLEMAEHIFLFQQITYCHMLERELRIGTGIMQTILMETSVNKNEHSFRITIVNSN